MLEQFIEHDSDKDGMVSLSDFPVMMDRVLETEWIRLAMEEIFKKTEPCMPLDGTQLGPRWTRRT